METLIKTVTATDHHRNGVSGTPFGVALFTMRDDDGNTRNMLGILFDGEDECCCAVLDVDLAACGNVRFAENSWRGDDFEPELRQAFKEAGCLD